jgi:sigma-B regulation protein RsbU (phosphoserine phosphatase)
MSIAVDQKKLYQKELEVNSLLEITQAINNNLAEKDLYKIYEFTLRANLQIGKMALYVMEEEWECKAQFGNKLDFSTHALSADYFDLKEITKTDLVQPDGSDFTAFDISIPVMHKSKLLAIVFVKSLHKDAQVLETTFLQAISNIMLVAIENKRLVRRQLDQQAYDRDMEIASNVQNYLFPKELPDTEKVEIKAFYQPCQTVGGDYYDYIPLEDGNQFLVCIADVSGKGVPAAILMSNFQASLRTISRNTVGPKVGMHELNYHLYRSANGENFITFFMAIYDFRTKQLRYVNAGHNPPVLMDDKGEVTLLTEGTTVLGAFDPLPFLNMGVIEDLEKFTLFLFTDGVTETFNEDEEEFGSDRLELFLASHAEESLDNTHKNLLKVLNQFKATKDFTDDLTFLSCKVNNVSS